MPRQIMGRSYRRSVIARATALVILIACGVSAWPLVAPALAQVVPTGGVDPVNTVTFSDQKLPAIAVGADGQSIIAWQSGGQDTSGWGIYARRYDAAGDPQGPEFPVNVTTASNQESPAVAMAPDGTFVIAWVGNGPGGTVGIVARRFAADGTPASGEIPVNGATQEAEGNPRVGIADDGRFVVAWSASVNPGGPFVAGVFARLFDTNGAPRGDQFRVTTTQELSQTPVSAMMAANGEFTILVHHVRGSLFPPGAPQTQEILARSFDADGIPLGTEQPLAGIATSLSSVAAGGMAADGRFVVAWTPSNPGGTTDVMARVFAQSGAPIGAVIPVNAQTDGNQYAPSVAVAADGRFLIAWQSFLVTPQAATELGVFVRHFSPDRDPRGTEVKVNTDLTGPDARPAVAISPDGRHATVAWQSQGQDGSGFGVYARRLAVNEPPTVALSGGTFTYHEGSGLQIIDPAAAVGDSDSADFAGGQLSVALDGGLGEDRLAILTESTGLIQVAGNVVTYHGVVIGTLSGGTGGGPLIVALNSNATPARVQALLRRVAYENLALQRSTAPRTLRVTLADGDGNVSSEATRPIQVVLAVDTTPGCAIRPRVRVNQAVSGGRLSVAIQTSPLSTGQTNPLVRLQFDDLVNALVTFNGLPVVEGQSINLPPNTTATQFTVERDNDSLATTVHFTVVDSCLQPWRTLVGGGTAAGF